MNKKRGRPFEKRNTYGQGRPPGSPNKKTFLAQQILLDEGGPITDTLIDLALKGHRVAQRLYMERLIPRLKPAAQLSVEPSESDSGGIELRIKEVDGTVYRYDDAGNKVIIRQGRTSDESPEANDTTPSDGPSEALED